MIDLVRLPGSPSGDDTCFCGCGRSTAFGRARALNRAAADAWGRPPGGAGEAGEPLLDAVLAVLHDDALPAEGLVARVQALAVPRRPGGNRPV